MPRILAGPKPQCLRGVTLAERMRESDEDPFLLCGPAHSDPSWVYRDFYPMPTQLWLELVWIVGEAHIQICSSNDEHIPPAPLCRAQIWISAFGKARWDEYLARHP